MDLNSKVVLITGASSGIGTATALRCAARGARLVLAARRADALAAVEQQVTALGQSALAIPTDVTDVGQVQHLADTALHHYGQVDVLVNNAGFGIFDSFIDAQVADLARMVQVNLYGTVHCIKALLPQMLQRQQGHIINVASIVAFVTTHNLAFYSATKFAVLGMSRALALDLRGTGIRVATICPHVVRTEFFAHADKRKLARVAYLVPWLTADNVARAITRTVEHNRAGEVVLPRIAAPLVGIGRAFPGFARLVTRLLG